MGNVFTQCMQYFARRAPPTRVGVLNTGELVLVSADGRAQVISDATTDLIRDVLVLAPFAHDTSPIASPFAALDTQPHHHHGVQP